MELKELYKYIALANKEYDKNDCRTDLFYQIESIIIKENNPAYIYFFARYARGADIQKLQNKVLNLPNVFKYGFYFVNYVEKADILPFLEKAVESKNIFWTNKFVEIARSKKITLDNELRAKVKTICTPSTHKGRHYSIDIILETAQQEYLKNGRSKKLIELEKEAIYFIGEGNMLLFAQYIDGVDLHKIEDATILQGNIADMCALIKNVEGIDSSLIYKWSILTLFDYQKARQMLRRHETENANYISNIEQAKESNNKKKLISALKAYRNFLNEWSYIDIVKDYRRQMRETLYAKGIKATDF